MFENRLLRRLPSPDPGQPDARSATRYLLWLVRNQRATILGGMVFGVLWMVSQALMPAVIGRTIDAGVIHRDAGALLRWSLVVLALGATTATSGILRHRNALVNFLGAGYSTVQVVTRQAVRLGATLEKQVAAGDVVAVGTADLAEIGGGLDVTARLAGAIVATITVAVIMLATSPPLGLVVLLGVPVLTALTGFLLRPLHERQRQFRVRQGELTARAIDIAAGLRVLRGIGGEAAFARRYRHESQQLRGAAVAVTRVESGLAAVEVLMPGVIVAGVTFLAARFAIDGRLTVGELVAFYGYAAFLAEPLRTLMEAADNITRAHVAARRVVRILNLKPQIDDPQGLVEGNPPGGGQPFRAARAETAESAETVEPAQLAEPLDSAQLADEESGLRIPPGSLFAVVCADPGEAEALAARLARFEDSGRASLGGTPLPAMRLGEVRRRILLARNSDRFFTGRLREELDVGGSATDEQIGEAIEAASARDVVDALSEGLETQVVDGGRSFSGGQLQRLRLARALLARRQFTILVEPTSAVDAHTEARIAENLAALHARWRSTEQDSERASVVAASATRTLTAVAVTRLADEERPHASSSSSAMRASLHAMTGTSTNDGDFSVPTAARASTAASRASVAASAAWTPRTRPADGSLTPRTTVLFTSSPLLLDHAHRVAYVEAGRVVAAGTHRELLAVEPGYAAVVARGEDE